MADTETAESGSIESVKDLGLPPASIVRRWLLELNLADKEEKEWREKTAKLWSMYRAKDTKPNAFNILWANTETLRPSLFNSLPRPDVRRRFKGEDPPAKLASQLLERGLVVALDSYDFESVMKSTVLDMLVGGRAVARVKYMPQFDPAPDDEESGGGEQVTYEQAVCEYVHWEDFRHGPGKRWEEVRWVAFRHEMTRAQMVEKFGELGRKVDLDSAKDDEVTKLDDPRVSELFKTGVVWEIWDKDDEQVLFISKAHKKEPLEVINDPLGLDEFFPCPPPLYAVEDTGTLTPTPLYELYREQAEELNRVSRRINKLINVIKLGGIYDPSIGSALGRVIKSDDNEYIPADDVVALIERGGLDKFIWSIPIDQAAQVLQILETSREAIKNTIYEITGISDILRGATDASETATAQNIKSQWGSLRLQRMQRDVQRFVRDIVRLTGEIIGEKFDPALLSQATDMNIPLAEEVMVQAQQAMMAGQPPPNEQPVTLEQVSELLRSDAMRGYRIDIETDSTIEDIAKQDQEEVVELLRGIVEFMNGIAPSVQSGAMPIEAAKALLMAGVRRFRLGAEVEDTLDAIQAPPPPPELEADPSIAAGMEAEKEKVQNDMMMSQAKMDADRERAQSDTSLAQAKLAQDKELEDKRIQQNWDVERMKLGVEVQPTPEQISALAESFKEGNRAEIAQVSQGTMAALSDVESRLAQQVQQVSNMMQQFIKQATSTAAGQGRAIEDIRRFMSDASGIIGGQGQAIEALRTQNGKKGGYKLTIEKRDENGDIEAVRAQSIN